MLTINKARRYTNMKKNRAIVCLLTVFTILFALLGGCGNTQYKWTGDFDYSEGLDENGFWKGIKATDFVEMFDYRQMHIPYFIHHISDDQVYDVFNNEILAGMINDGVLSEYALHHRVFDRAVENGDAVNIDFVGTVGGVEFENGSTEGMGEWVIIGVTSYIDDFLQQLIGHMPGETVNVEVTFPFDYPQMDLRGEDALFVTVINYIAGDRELTDGFVEENLSPYYGWVTIDEMSESVRKTLQDYAINEYIWLFFTSQVTIKSIPAQLVNHQINAMLKFSQDNAESYGMDLETYLTQIEGFADIDELIEAQEETNLKGAAVSLVVQAIAEDAGIEVSRADIAEYFSEDDMLVFEESYGLPYLNQYILTQKIIAFIIDNALFE